LGAFERLGVAHLALGFVRSPPQSQLSCHQKLPSRSEQLTKAAYPCTQAPSLLATDPPSKSLSVVIPAYNEELRLPATLEETMRYLQQRRAKRPTFTYEVIVVDDGSTDSTSEVAFEYVKRHGVDAVRLLTLRSNKGKGQAVKSGIMCSRGKNVLFMDADGATAIEEVEKLEKKLREGAEETQRVMVVGSRAHMQSAATAKRCVSDRMVSPSSFPHDSIRFDPVRSIYHAPLDPTHPD
jgi:glycosyltransferase involved in cell wall biosynthesis